MKDIRAEQNTSKQTCGIMSVQKSTSKQDRMLPPAVAALLRVRDTTDTACPDEILSRINSLKIGKVLYNFKTLSVAPVPASPIQHSSSGSNLNTLSGGLSGAWRSSPKGSTGGGFRTANNGGGGGGGFHGTHGGGAGFHGTHGGGGGSWGSNNMSIRRVPSEHNNHRDEETPRARYRGTPASPAEGTGSPFPPGGRYVSAIVSDKKVEDRIIGHIRAKLNKFSQLNYDSVKSFLEQIMSSGETEFLTEFMELLFMKAASEETFCELYVRLLSELTEKFPHLKGQITNIYSNFILIFKEARDIPDQSTADYKKFLDAQERKKFRSGYSHFLAEIYNKNLLPQDAIEITIGSIIDSLRKCEGDASNTLLAEEYLVSLYKIVSTVNMCKSAPLPPYVVNMIDFLQTTLAKPKPDTPGYTIKSRFKIMDIIDKLPN